MKHQHFDVGTAGFYGAYWACAGGSDCAVIAMIGDDPANRAASTARRRVDTSLCTVDLLIPILSAVCLTVALVSMI